MVFPAKGVKLEGRTDGHLGADTLTISILCLLRRNPNRFSITPKGIMYELLVLCDLRLD